MLAVLEFSKPRQFPVKQAYKLYSKYILPAIGSTISKDTSAYTYLPESVEAFPEGQNFLNVMKKVGFKNEKDRPLTFGISSLYTAVK